MASPTPRETRKPDFPAVVHTYTDVLRILRAQPCGDVAHLADLTGRDRSNIRRDMPKLVDAGVIEHDGACWILTDKGRQWVAGQDVAEGLASAGGSTAPTNRWPVDKIRPNPANRPVDPETLPDLALSIISAGDILQPLILTPADANGVRMILAGERRWRAVRSIMDQDAEAQNENVLDGEPVFFNDSLPVDLEAGVPFVEREATEAEALQITIIENSQRQDLSPWEDAQLLLQLQIATGWNASELARQIGRASEGERSGIRDVQTKLKIAREASPDAIAAYLDNRSWDQLRSSVSQPKAPTLSDLVAEHGAAMPNGLTPLPLEQAIETAGAPAKENWDDAYRRKIRSAIDALTPKQFLVLVEVADHISRYPKDGKTPCRDSMPDPTRSAQHLIENASLGFSYYQGQTSVSLGQHALEYLLDKSLLQEGVSGVVDYRLGLLRQEALGIGAEAALRQSGRYWTEWLNIQEALPVAPVIQSAPTGPHVVNGVDYGNATRAQEARYAAGILQRPAANYGSAPRHEAPVSPPPGPTQIGTDRHPHIEPGRPLIEAFMDEDQKADRRAELAERRIERLGAALQVLTDRLEPVLAILRGARSEDGLVAFETDDADYYDREITEACAWAEDALAESTTVFDGWGEASPRPSLSEPAVPIRKSITPDFLVCLEDGRKFKSLKRHLRTRYNLSPEDYRKRWGLPADYPMVAPNYAKAREDLARQMGLSRAGAR